MSELGVRDRRSLGQVTPADAPSSTGSTARTARRNTTRKLSPLIAQVLEPDRLTLDPPSRGNGELGAPADNQAAARPPAPSGGKFVSLRTRPAGAAAKAATRGPASEATLALAARVEYALHEHSQLVLDAVASDPAALPFDGRLFPRDVGDAVLRLRVAVHQVKQALASGELGEQALAAARKKTTSGADAVIALAIERLDRREVDLDEGAAALRADPLWTSAPLTLVVDGQRRELGFDLVGGFLNKLFHRSAQSVAHGALDPEGPVRSLSAHPIGKRMLDAVRRYADPPDLDRPVEVAQSELARGAIRLAALFHEGREVPRNSTQAVLALSLVTGAPLPTSDEELDALVDEFWKLRDQGRLLHLEPGPAGEAMLRQLETMAGPRAAGGEALLARLAQEEAGLGKRRKWSERLDLVGASALSFTVGGLVSAQAMRLATAGKLSGAGVKASGIAGSFGAFTTTTQLKHRGELTWGAAAHDAAMFAMLAGVGRLAGSWASRLPPGPVRVGAVHTAMVGSTATALTGVDAVMNAEMRNWPAAKQRFIENLETIAILHTVSAGLARRNPELDTNQQVRAHHEKLSAELSRTQEQVAGIAVSIRQLLDRSPELTDLPRSHPKRAAAAQDLGALFERLDNAARDAESLGARFVRFSGKSAEKAAAQGAERSLEEVRSVLATDLSTLTFEAALLKRIAANMTANANAATPISRGEMARFIFETWQHVRDESRLELTVKARSRGEGSYLPARPLPRDAVLRALDELLPTLSGEPKQKLEGLRDGLRQSRSEWAPAYASRQLHELLGERMSVVTDAVRASVPRELLERAVERHLRATNEDAVMFARELGDEAAPFRRAQKELASDPMIREWRKLSINRIRSWVELSPEALSRVRQVTGKPVEEIVPRAWLEDLLSPEVLKGEVLAAAKRDKRIKLAELQAELASAKAENRDWVLARSGTDALAKLLWSRMPRSRAHDWDEPAPLALVELEIRKAREAGETIPREVLRLVADAKSAGRDWVAVGKGEELVLRDLANTKNTGGVAGWGLRLHRLSLHHNAAGSTASAADLVNALRQRRGYKEPMTFAEIEAYMLMLRRTQQIDAATYHLLLQARFQQEKLEGQGQVWSN